MRTAGYTLEISAGWIKKVGKGYGGRGRPLMRTAGYALEI